MVETTTIRKSSLLVGLWSDQRAFDLRSAFRVRRMPVMPMSVLRMGHVHITVRGQPSTPGNAPVNQLTPTRSTKYERTSGQYAGLQRASLRCSSRACREPNEIASRDCPVLSGQPGSRSSRADCSRSRSAAGAGGERPLAMTSPSCAPLAPRRRDPASASQRASGASETGGIAFGSPLRARLRRPRVIREVIAQRIVAERRPRVTTRTGSAKTRVGRRAPDLGWNGTTWKPAPGPRLKFLARSSARHPAAMSAPGCVGSDGYVAGWWMRPGATAHAYICTGAYHADSLIQ